MAPDFLMIILVLITILQHKYDIFCQENDESLPSGWKGWRIGGEHSLSLTQLSDKMYPIIMLILKGCP